MCIPVYKYTHEPARNEQCKAVMDVSFVIRVVLKVDL